jgi:hypothetical protein
MSPRTYIYINCVICRTGPTPVRTQRQPKITYSFMQHCIIFYDDHHHHRDRALQISSCLHSLANPRNIYLRALTNDLLDSKKKMICLCNKVHAKCHVTVMKYFHLLCAHKMNNICPLCT